jgi:hypothetical protein
LQILSSLADYIKHQLTAETFEIIYQLLLAGLQDESSFEVGDARKEDVGLWMGIRLSARDRAFLFLLFSFSIWFWFCLCDLLVSF